MFRRKIWQHCLIDVWKAGSVDINETLHSPRSACQRGIDLRWALQRKTWNTLQTHSLVLLRPAFVNTCLTHSAKTVLVFRLTPWTRLVKPGMESKLCTAPSLHVLHLSTIEGSAEKAAGSVQCSVQSDWVGGSGARVSLWADVRSCCDRASCVKQGRVRSDGAQCREGGHYPTLLGWRGQFYQDQYLPHAPCLNSPAAFWCIQPNHISLDN